MTAVSGLVGDVLSGARASEIEVRRAAAAADAGDIARARRGFAAAQHLPPAFVGARTLAEGFLALAEERAAGAERTSELAALRSQLWSR